MQAPEEDKNNFVGMNGEVNTDLFRIWVSGLLTGMLALELKKNAAK